jgi:hypothetical protein
MAAPRSSYSYEPRPDRNAELREELIELARQKPRFGHGDCRRFWNVAGRR